MQLAAIGVGSVMGVAWVTLMGPLLGAAGPILAATGFLIGGLVMLLTAFCYAELTAAMPSAGGEVLYAHEVLGPGAAFAIGWFLLFMAIALTSFEAISLAWLLNKIFPALAGTTLYEIAGQPIDSSSLAIGLIAMLGIAVTNLMGSRATGQLQFVFTLMKGVAVASFIFSGFLFGKTANLSPLFAQSGHGSPFLGMMWIVASAPFWHAGFQVVAQAVEERRPDVSLSTVGWITIATVIFSTLFYPSVFLAASMALPWESLVNADLPAEVAMNAAFGNALLAKACLLGAVLGVLATWNASLIWAARLFLALGRARLLPQRFGRISERYGSPSFAIVVTTLLGIPGVFMGRAAFLPIVNTASISVAFGFSLTCLAAARLRRSNPYMERPFKMPGGETTAWLGFVTTALMIAYILFEPLVSRPGQIPAEWVMLSAWGMLGLIAWQWVGKLGLEMSPEQRRAALLGREP